VTVLFKAGAHVPLYPFCETVGKALKLPPIHIGATIGKVGIRIGFIICTSVTVGAHKPELGVKVYVVVEAVLTAGLQVPGILLSDIEDKTGSAAPVHKLTKVSKVGVTFGSTTTVANVVSGQAILPIAPEFMV
jgi:hypothetical protein